MTTKRIRPNDKLDNETILKESQLDKLAKDVAMESLQRAVKEINRLDEENNLAEEADNLAEVTEEAETHEEARNHEQETTLVNQAATLPEDGLPADGPAEQQASNPHQIHSEKTLAIQLHLMMKATTEVIVSMPIRNKLSAHVTSRCLIVSEVESN